MNVRFDLADHKLRFVTERCRDKDVLDLGCVQHSTDNVETPYWLHGAVVAVARHVVGLDIDCAGVEYLRGRGYDVVCGNACALDLGRQFDVIVAGDIVEHLDNLGGFFSSCGRHLRPGGSLLVSTPNPWYWRNVVKAALFSEVANNPEHTCWLCVRTLKQVAARHGFAVRHVEFGSRYLRDRCLPLPTGLKHTSFHAVLRPA